MIELVRKGGVSRLAPHGRGKTRQDKKFILRFQRNMLSAGVHPTSFYIIIITQHTYNHTTIKYYYYHYYLIVSIGCDVFTFQSIFIIILTNSDKFKSSSSFFKFINSFIFKVEGRSI